MTLLLILTTGFTFFVGQPNWYELDTVGVEWTMMELCHEADEACDLNIASTEEMS